MKIQHLFTINIFYAIFFGISGSFFPGLWISFYGLDYNSTALWAIRLAGGSILGYSALM
jgi:hypothetical protein